MYDYTYLERERETWHIVLPLCPDILGPPPTWPWTRPLNSGASWTPEAPHCRRGSGS